MNKSMTEEMAMKYEHLITAAFKCDRWGVAGANADLYHFLEHQASLESSEKGDKFELGVIMGRVVAYIENALKTVRKEHSANNEFTEKIDECLSLIIPDPTMPKINACVDQAREAFESIGLF